MDDSAHGPTWPQAPLDADLVIAVAVGGAAGSVVRWLLAELIPAEPGQFAWSTVIVNLVGSALVGVLAGLRPRWPRSRLVYDVLTVGVLGGFTTFSAYALYGTWLIEYSRYWPAAGFLIGSVLAGVVAAALGLVVGARVGRRPLPSDEPAGRS